MKITADFSKITGKIKPMHGVGQPPFAGTDSHLFHYLTEAGVPYSRLHDVGGWYGKNIYVDVPNLFRDFDADADDPASYDFAHTDWLLSELTKAGIEPFFRLGVTIENAHLIRAYRIFPPKDNQKWAQICEHIVRHYNEGWANGFHMGITYWEIWNEPDDCRRLETASMWRGTAEEYFELYDAAAKHLKACFGDSIRVGGFASCGFYSKDDDPDLTRFETGSADTDYQYFLEFAHRFLQYVKEHKTPLDFFSWHTYEDVPEALRSARYCRKLLNKYGFSDVPDICNEWNPINTLPADRRKRERDSDYYCARTLAFMLGMQRETTSLLCYYDARIGASEYGALFNPDTWEPYRAYYAFVSFNAAYRLGNEVETASDDENVFVLGAEKDGKRVLLAANISPDPVTIEFCVKGADVSLGEIVLTDREYLHTLTGQKVTDGKLTIKGNSCLEIRL